MRVIAGELKGRRLTAPVLRLDPGPWTPPPEGSGLLGMIAREGRRLVIQTRRLAVGLALTSMPRAEQR